MTGRTEVSIVGTAITNIPLAGQPEFAGIVADDDTPPRAHITHGLLLLDLPDRDTAVAWRCVLQQVVEQFDAHDMQAAIRIAQPDRDDGWQHVTGTGGAA